MCSDERCGRNSYCRQVKRANESFAELEKGKEELETEIKKYIKVVDDLQVRLDESDTKNNEKLETIGMLKQRIQDLESDKLALEKDRNALEDEREGFTQAILKLSKVDDENTLKKEIVALKEENDTLKGDNIVLQVKIAKLKAKIEWAKERHALTYDEFMVYREQNNSLRSALDDRKQLCEVKDELLTEYKEMCIKHEEAHSLMNEKIAKLEEIVITQACMKFLERPVEEKQSPIKDLPIKENPLVKDLPIKEDVSIERGTFREMGVKSAEISWGILRNHWLQARLNGKWVNINGYILMSDQRTLTKDNVAHNIMDLRFGDPAVEEMILPQLLQSRPQKEVEAHTSKNETKTLSTIDWFRVPKGTHLTTLDPTTMKTKECKFDCAADAHPGVWVSVRFIGEEWRTLHTRDPYTGEMKFVNQEDEEKYTLIPPSVLKEEEGENEKRALKNAEPIERGSFKERGIDISQLEYKDVFCEPFQVRSDKGEWGYFDASDYCVTCDRSSFIKRGINAHSNEQKIEDMRFQDPSVEEKYLPKQQNEKQRPPNDDKQHIPIERGSFNERGIDVFRISNDDLMCQWLQARVNGKWLDIAKGYYVNSDRRTITNTNGSISDIAQLRFKDPAIEEKYLPDKDKICITFSEERPVNWSCVPKGTRLILSKIHKTKECTFHCFEKNSSTWYVCVRFTSKPNKIRKIAYGDKFSTNLKFVNPKDEEKYTIKYETPPLRTTVEINFSNNK